MLQGREAPSSLLTFRKTFPVLSHGFIESAFEIAAVLHFIFIF